MKKIIVLLACAFSALTAFDQKKSDKIVGILESYILDRDIDAESIGIEVCNQKPGLHPAIIKKITSTNEALVFTIVGFPFKSVNNKHKVIASAVDAAERYSLVYMNDLMKELSIHYGSPVKLVIFMDGMVFCDIEDVPYSVVAQYESDIKQLCKDLEHIEIKTLSDIMPNSTPEQMRYVIENITTEVPENTDSFKNEVSLLKKRLAFEFAGDSNLKNLDSIAKVGVIRSIKFSQFLDAYRPNNSIRLSVHFQKQTSNKIGIKLSPDSCVTPWHGALVVDDNRWRIEHKKDINLNNVIETSMVVNGMTLPYYVVTRR